MMRLQKATSAAIIALIYIFLSRLLGTFFPEFFQDLTVAKINTLLILLSYTGLLFFSICFLMDYVQPRQNDLKNGAIILTIAISIITILQIKNVISVFLSYRYAFLAQRFLIEPIAAWVATVMSLVFLIIFYRHYTNGKKLKNAIGLAIAGSAIGLIPRTLTSLQGIIRQNLSSLQDYNIFILTFGFFLIAFSFYTSIKFLLVFYEQQLAKDK